MNSKHKLPIAFSITEMALDKDNFSSGYFFASVIHASEDFLIWINQDYRFPFRNAQVAKAIQRPVGSSRYDFKRALLSTGFTEISEGMFMPCLTGTFSNFSGKEIQNCVECPPGNHFF